ncbi:uncharacterized protein LOC144703395 [Wolffia australiana]
MAAAEMIAAKKRILGSFLGPNNPRFPRRGCSWVLDESWLSVALSHFRPLAGRLAIDKHEHGGGISVYIDCDDRGAAFRLAAADGVHVADVEARSKDVPAFVSELFPCNGAINYDGVSLHLLAVQLTKLEDGVFLGCSFNHVVGDGAAFWNFCNAWAEISRSPTSRLASVPSRCSRGGSRRLCYAASLSAAWAGLRERFTEAMNGHSDEAIRRMEKVDGGPVVYPYCVDGNILRQLGEACGSILAYPGREGGGSIDLEVSLSPDVMAVLELDAELNRVRGGSVRLLSSTNQVAAVIYESTYEVRATEY